MSQSYTRKHKKQLAFYFRCLSGVCVEGLLNSYYMVFDFHKTDRFLRNHLLKKALKQWDITDAESLRSRIRWLLDDGYREAYADFHFRLAALNAASRRIEADASGQEEDTAKQQVVLRMLPSFPSGEIAAFGGGWAIYLARIGLVYGWLTRQEAWDLQLEAAARLQRKYRSWGEYLIAFAAGSHFAADDSEMKQFAHVRGMGNVLYGNSTLAAKRLVWYQNLEPGQDEARVHVQ